MHTQTTPSTIWTITHNLNLRPISIIITDQNYNVILPETIQFTSANVVKIVFSAAQDGYAHLTFGSPDFGAVNASIIPDTTDAYDLGSSAKEWKEVWATDAHLSDLHLSNERGDWTVIEEVDYLTVRNNKTDKVYKLLMEEI
jgi:hypothetical protein